MRARLRLFLNAETEKWYTHVIYVRVYWNGWNGGVVRVYRFAYSPRKHTHTHTHGTRVGRACKIQTTDRKPWSRGQHTKDRDNGVLLKPEVRRELHANRSRLRWQLNATELGIVATCCCGLCLLERTRACAHASCAWQRARVSLCDISDALASCKPTPHTHTHKSISNITTYARARTFLPSVARARWTCLWL